MKFFIEGNVPSLKNSKVMAGFGKPCPSCRRPPVTKLIPSKTVQKWFKETKRQWVQLQPQFVKEQKKHDLPLQVKFTFIRDSQRRFDYTNALDTVQDAMVTFGWIEDDNSDIIVPIIGGVRYDSSKAGVEIEI